METGEDVLAILDRLHRWLYIYFLVAIVIAFIITAFMYLTAAGDPEKLKRAHRMLKYGIVAGAVFIVSGGILGLIESLLNP